MQAFFLSDSVGNIPRVYAPETLKTICDITGASPVQYDKAAVLAQPEQFRDAKFIFSTWGMPVFSEEEIAQLFPKLEAIFYAAGTVQAFARPFLNRGVRIFSAWMANGVPVAEYTVAQIILANKGFFSRSAQMRRGEYQLARDMHSNYPGNYDARIGIIGTGAIGARVCRMLKNYHMTVLACSLELTEEKAQELGVQIADMETVFRTCHVVSNHLPNNPHTVGILKKEYFASMRHYATFLNTGRGAQVDEPGMIEVLQQRPDLTAVLDVTFPEPPVAGSPLYTLPNCVLTPHVAGSAGNEVHRMAAWMAQEFIRYRSGEACQYEVTAKMLETMA